MCILPCIARNFCWFISWNRYDKHFLWKWTERFHFIRTEESPKIIQHSTATSTVIRPGVDTIRSARWAQQNTAAVLGAAKKRPIISLSVVSTNLLPWKGEHSQSSFTSYAAWHVDEKYGGQKGTLKDGKKSYLAPSLVTSLPVLTGAAQTLKRHKIPHWVKYARA